ncbi:MAG: lysozyme inhibitor LprI family protein, partial [Sphingomicrobium sp.]
GRLVINLPPTSKLSASGVLFADVRYTIQRSANGDRDIYDVSGAEDIISLLAGNQARELSEAEKADAKRYGPSFTCSPSNNDVEKMICDDAELARLDRYLNQLYDEALIFSNAPGYKSQLREFQNQFLEDRNACRTTDCIADAYRAQMENLQEIMNIPARLDPEIAPDT